jgi:hypothetical protein
VSDKLVDDFLARSQSDGDKSVSESKQQDIRRIEDVTDDEIVNAIAECGIDGLDNEDPWEGNAFEQVCLDLRLVNADSNSDDISNAEMELSDRIGTLEDAGRLSNPCGDRIYLTAQEWGPWLAGKSAAEIVAALRGGKS